MLSAELLSESARRWCVAAQNLGVSANNAKKEATRIPQLVRDWMDSWDEQRDSPPRFIKRDDDLPFSVEILCKERVLFVITHMRETLGYGSQSCVKASLVFLS